MKSLIKKVGRGRRAGGRIMVDICIVFDGSIPFMVIDLDSPSKDIATCEAKLTRATNNWQLPYLIEDFVSPQYT